MMRKQGKLPGIMNKERHRGRYIVVMVTSKITKNKNVEIPVVEE